MPLLGDRFQLMSELTRGTTAQIFKYEIAPLPPCWWPRFAADRPPMHVCIHTELETHGTLDNLM